MIHKDLKDIATIVRSMDIELLSADPSLCGHQTSQQNKEVMDTSIIGTKILDRAITNDKSMDTFLRIAL